MADRRWAMVTSERGSRLDPDLSLARAAFERAGERVDVVRWDDADVSWEDYDLVLVRSCWDYTWRLAEFLAWAEQVPRLRNANDVVRWNSDKRYMQDLAAAGCPVVPTVWSPRSADELPPAREWVVKPSVSAGSRDTARWTEPQRVLGHVAELVAAGRQAMVQPYVAAVDEEGETALLYLGGSFSHAVRKGQLLRRGEGVRQDRDSRGDLRPRTARPDQLDIADQVLRAAAAVLGGGTSLLYARVDLVDGPDGVPLLLELELVEPSFFLPQVPQAADRLVTAVVEEARTA